MLFNFLNRSQKIHIILNLFLLLLNRLQFNPFSKINILLSIQTLAKNLIRRKTLHFLMTQILTLGLHLKLLLLPQKLIIQKHLIDPLSHLANSLPKHIILISSPLLSNSQNSSFPLEIIPETYRAIHYQILDSLKRTQETLRSNLIITQLVNNCPNGIISVLPYYPTYR